MAYLTVTVINFDKIRGSIENPFGGLSATVMGAVPVLINSRMINMVLDIPIEPGEFANDNRTHYTRIDLQKPLCINGTWFSRCSWIIVEEDRATIEMMLAGKRNTASQPTI